MEKRILITGASGGLGTILLEHAFKKGYQITAQVNTHNAHNLINETLPEKSLIIVKKDFTDDPTLEIDYTTIDSAIICHGQMYNTNPLDLDIALFCESMRVNCISSISIAQKLISSWLKRNHKGNIVYISSVATRTTSPHEILYHSAKSATESALSGLSREYTKDGICINIIGPGLMDTPMGKEAIANRPDILNRIPTKQPVSTDEVSKLAFLLLETRSIAGAYLPINSGRWTNAAG